MRLSEAIMLGSTLGERLSNYSWDTCLLGISCHALGTSNHNNREAIRRWPWLRKIYTAPPDLHLDSCYSGETILTSLCERIANGEMTIELAAEIVREIEPDEPEMKGEKNAVCREDVVKC